MNSRFQIFLDYFSTERPPIAVANPFMLLAVYRVTHSNAILVLRERGSCNGARLLSPNSSLRGMEHPVVLATA